MGNSDLQNPHSIQKKHGELMSLHYVPELSERTLRETENSWSCVRLIKTNRSNTLGNGMFVHPVTVKQDYLQEVPAILHDNLQRKGPHTR
jgi:hypothetical protein